MNKITAVEEDKYTKEHFGELVDDSDIQARYPSDSVSIFSPISSNLIGARVSTSTRWALGTSGQRARC